MIKQPDRDLFYVGYLPLPKAIGRFLVPWLIGNFVLVVSVVVVVAQQHREPGNGLWQTGEPITVIGMLVDEPYPLLRTKDKSYILVEQGKRGVQDRLGGLDLGVSGAWQVTGYLIEREGRSILELDDGWRPSPLAPVVPDDLPVDSFDVPSPVDHGVHTLRGEIVDPKCYLGVMQPGDGKTHKTCATLCIKGGIPPMLLVKDDRGNTAAYLVTDHEGKAFPESHHAYIADPIEVTGRVLQEGDLWIFRADLGSLRRLGGKD